MPSAVGTYYWIAPFAGDANNAAAAGECGDPNESSVVSKRASTIATEEVLVPNDKAIIGGGGAFDASGTATFQLFKPDNPTCSAAGTAAVSLTGSTSRRSPVLAP